MDFLLAILASVTAAYVFLLALVVRSLPMARVSETAVAGDLPPVSVIVAARDEEQCLPACMEALVASRYPSDRLEFIIVDDGSQDATARLVRERAAIDPRFRLLQVTGDKHLNGKAGALDLGIRAARYEHLALTDADCRPSEGWLETIVRQLDRPGTGLISSVALVRNGRLSEQVQAMDWLFLLTCAASACSMGRPISAMGNSMALRKSAYETIGGYERLPVSVTEDYELFRAIGASPSWTARLLSDTSLLNYTEPVAGLRAAFSQRKRWARGGLRAPLWLWGIYIGSFMLHAGLPAAVAVVPLAGLPMLGLKLVADALVLRAGARQAGARIAWSAFPLFEAWFFAYQVVMPFALALRPRIRWKGRHH